MSLFIPERNPQIEQLDRGDLPADEVELSLADIRFVNRFWGGHRTAGAAAIRLLRPDGAGTATLLDVGSGTSDVSLAVARRVKRIGVCVRVVALDRQLSHLAAAKRLSGSAPGAPALLAGNALELPLPDGSVDWVFSSLFLHHLSPEENVRVLREMARVARRGLFILDLRRHRIARWLVGALGPIFFRSAVSVADGCASVEQAYTIEEVARIARAAGLARFQVRKVSPFRLELSART